MKCPRCQHDNRAQAKFCEQCAAPLQRHCSNCGSTLPESAKFCSECAHPVAAPSVAPEHAERPVAAASSAPVGEGDRRQATVLVADISGYTALCARLDAEQVQALLGRFYDLTDRIIANYGGHVIDHAGDATLAVFGAPVAHDNDGERAARAAIDIHAQAAAIADPTGRTLSLHIGIASGEVVAATIAGGAQPRYAVTGEAVNLAARLNALAQAGQTIISEPVWRSVARVFEAQPLGEVSVKGFVKPVAVWKVVGPRRAGAERRSFIGRQTELRQLLGVLDAVEEARSGLAVCVRGEAGIGKSRLIDELRQHAQARGFACHTGWVLDFGVGKGQDAIPAIVKDMLEVGIQADEAALRAAVQGAVASDLIPPEQQMLITDLLELPQPAELRGAFDAMDNATRAQRMGEMIVGFAQRCTLTRPRVIIVEDIHWAAPSLLRYLALLTRAVVDSRMILIMTTRFEGDPLDSTWRASTHGSPLMTIDLGPLRAEEAKLLVAGLMETSNRVALECIERAEGNPLFLEQLLRSAAESEAASLPASIQSLVLARMDRLGPRDKAALQAASVLGKRFTLGAVCALSDDADYHCDALVAGDLVRPEGVDYVFAHALIQEGVYSSLLNTKKRELHRRAAQWFGEQEPILRAEHLDRASDPEAAQAYLAAAKDRMGKFRHEFALRLAERGTELAGEDTVRCKLWLIRGDLLREAGRSGDSLAAFESARSCATDDEQRCHAWMGIVAAHRVTADIPAAMAALDQAQAIAQGQGSAAQRSRIHHVRGNLFFALGKSDECRSEHERALDYAQQAGEIECEAQALSGLGDAQYLQGRLLTGLEYFRRCVGLCERAGFAKVQIPNRVMVGHCLYYANRMDHSFQQIHLALEEAQRFGQVQSEIFAQESLGLLLGAKGDFRSAELALLSGIPLARRAQSRRYLSAMLYSLALVRLAAGAHLEARTLLDEALALARQTGPAFAGPLILSGISCVEQSHADAKRALGQGEAVLREPCISHCHLHFYRNAIDVSLHWRDWDEALRYAAALESYVSAEPLPWATLVIERARALAALGSGKHGDAVLGDLRRIRDEIARVGMLSALPGLDFALAAA
jgi:class 3 adenylate cyclase/tetratricopeptide (TPR) repeat protein